MTVDVRHADVALRVSGLSVRHGGLVAVHDVSMDIHRGEIAGLIGPNGAGKTTFIDTLSGFTRPVEGEIEMDGRPLHSASAHERARVGLVRTFQSLELFDDLSVTENLEVAATRAHRWSLLSDLLAPRARDSRRIEETLDRLGLVDVAGRSPSQLSNGQRHLVALARALVSRPKVLLLDEPAAGLDTNETAELSTVLRSLPEDGISVLLVDHDMSVVLGVCDRVHVLDFGELIASGTPSEIRANSAVISAYLGRETHR